MPLRGERKAEKGTPVIIIREIPKGGRAREEEEEEEVKVASNNDLPLPATAMNAVLRAIVLLSARSGRV